MYHTFGPGRLESVRLHVRQRKVGYTRHQVKVTGSYTIYCGMGNDHTVSVRSGWVDVPDIWTGDDIPRDLARDDFRDALASQLIKWHLEDWYDPCDEYQGPDYN